jgi:predicted ATP-dependent endonuclease of OLD family
LTVRAIRLENFMAFADTGWIELRPISLLFGRNSSGKSALIRALRLLKQSRDQSPDAPPVHFPLNFLHEYGLDQGGFENSVNLRPLEVAEQEQDPPLRDARQRVITFHLRCELVETADALLGLVNRYLASV